MGVPPLVLSVATTYTTQVANFEASLQRHGWEHRLLALGEPWVGWETKMGAMESALASLVREGHGDRIVIHSDSSDVLARLPPSTFMRRYAEHFSDFDVVLSGEPGCAGYCCTPVTRLWTQMGGRPANGHLNAGLVAGKAAALLEIVRRARASNEEDEQKAWGEVVQAMTGEELRHVTMDRTSLLFYNDSLAQTATHVGGDRLNDPFVGATDAVFNHFPGMRHKGSRMRGDNYSKVGSGILASRFMPVNIENHAWRNQLIIVICVCGALLLLVIVFATLYTYSRSSVARNAQAPIKVVR